MERGLSSVGASIPVGASPAIRTAAVMYVALGVGFGVGTAISLVLFARDGQLPMTPWGFRALEGPVTASGSGPIFVLGGLLVVVCALDVVAGTWLWHGRRRGGVLGLATTAPALALGAAFALPFLLIGVPIRSVLVVAGWRGLR